MRFPRIRGFSSNYLRFTRGDLTRAKGFGAQVRWAGSLASIEVANRASDDNGSRKLSSRLNSALELCARPDFGSLSAPGGRVIADIGADHAMLSIALLKRGIASRLYAVDRCRIPLESGRANADQSLSPELRPRIEFRCGDGLVPLRPGDAVDTVCVLGMGLHRIVKILGGAKADDERNRPTDAFGELGGAVDGGSARAIGARRLVLQPGDSRPHLMVLLRRWLLGRGWAITDEQLSSGGKGGRLFLTVLAEWCGGGGGGGGGAPSCALTQDGPAHLVLPQSIQRRAREATAQVVAPGLGFLRAPSSAARELELWGSYLTLHKDWARVPRFKAYDRISGLPEGAISAALDAEVRVLKELGSSV